MTLSMMPVEREAMSSDIVLNRYPMRRNWTPRRRWLERRGGDKRPLSNITNTVRLRGMRESNVFPTSTFPRMDSTTVNRLRTNSTCTPNGLREKKLRFPVTYDTDSSKMVRGLRFGVNSSRLTVGGNNHIKQKPMME